MKTVWAIALSVLCLTLPALAQDTQAGGGGRFRNRGNRNAGPGVGQRSLTEVTARLADRLGLTDEHRAPYDQLVAQYTSAWDEAQKQAAQRRDLARQAREARRSGDEKRADELRAQMSALGNGPMQVLGEFADAVEPMLDEQQVAQLDQFRQRTQQRRGQAARAAGALGAIRQLPGELQLDDAQKAQFDALLADERQRFQEVRPLMRELRQARQSGDEAKVAELQQQIAEKRGQGDGMQAFYQKLEPILTTEQKAKLAESRAKVAGRLASADSVRTLFQTARKLDLRLEQRNRLREIVRGATGSVNENEMKADARAALVQSVHKQIIEMLDAKQAAEFEKLLQAEQRPASATRPAAARTRAREPSRASDGPVRPPAAEQPTGGTSGD